MNDEQLLRYNRHILLPAIDISGQQRLLDARVMIIGIGGLGSPAAMYLASSGVGHLTLIDDDTVEISNLQRQPIHHQTDIGRTKVDSARDTLHDLNPDCAIDTIDHRLDEDSLRASLGTIDVVLDCTDNFSSRYLINRACVATGTPLISGAALGFDGQVSMFSNTGDSPCYHCLYPDGGEDDQGSCTDNGVVAPLVGIIGSMQAQACINLLCGIDLADGHLLCLDAKGMEWRSSRFRKDSACPVCSGH